LIYFTVSAGTIGTAGTFGTAESFGTGGTFNFHPSLCVKI